jgi:hypothetical protein
MASPLTGHGGNAYLKAQGLIERHLANQSRFIRQFQGGGINWGLQAQPWTPRVADGQALAGYVRVMPLVAGRFPWRAPIGGKEGPNIKPDTKRAPLIRRALKVMATGWLKKTDILKISFALQYLGTYFRAKPKPVLVQVVELNVDSGAARPVAVAEYLAILDITLPLICSNTNTYTFPTPST